ncbi:glycosyltransferase family 2 protein [Vibrio sp. 1-Bac 57]
MPKIVAIVVSYYPDESDLLNLCEAIKGQVHKIFVVDNTPNQLSFLNDYTELNVNCFHLQENMGIAYAQNFGIKEALNEGFTDFLLLDQDSTPLPDMVEKLLATRSSAEIEGIRVGAVGPQQVDLHRNDLLTPFVCLNGHKIELIYNSSKTYCETCFLIASGCLISAEALKSIGYKEEDLFIDCVDLEWGFRATSKGFSCIGSFQAKLNHELGDIPLKVFGRELTYHSPLRHYYFYRNFYFLLRRNYVPTTWKIHVLFKSSMQAFIFSLFSREPVAQVKMIFKGVCHGLIGKMGKYEE